jgi:flagellar basal body-associated protein FliL
MKVFIFIMILGVIILSAIFIYSKYFKQKSIFDEPKLPMPLYKQ